jgi:hypothetical protein
MSCVVSSWPERALCPGTSGLLLQALFAFMGRSVEKVELDVLRPRGNLLPAAGFFS